MLTSFSFWSIFSIVLALTNVAANNFDSQRVLGGYRPEKHMLAKHYVVVYYVKGYSCGGSIITPNTILTAAHCVSDGREEYHRGEIKIAANIINRNTDQDTAQVINVNSIRIHEGYQDNGLKLINDIAVLRLATSVIENGITVQRIPIATRKTAAGTICTMLGFGQVLPNGPFAAELTYANLSILSNRKCRKIFRQSKWSFLNLRTTLQIRRTTICTAAELDGIGPCRGDGGAPLICNGLLVGIVSVVEGPSCGDGVAVYTNVYRYRGWIENRANISLGVDARRLLSLAVALVVMVMH